MNVRDSSGRSVSLLNDEPSDACYSPPRHSTAFDSPRCNSSSPVTPGFVRADSFDSYTNSPRSTTSTTPLNVFNCPVSYAGAITRNHLQNTYATKLNLDQNYGSSPSHGRDYPKTYDACGAYTEPQIYDEDSYSSRTLASERNPKRYPCRYRDSHHCLKTFTTSGHASRHSKIHTAEKGVSCTWEGCHKKFTRSDNMKQHLETHTKEKSRAAKTPSSISSLRSSLTVSAGVKKASLAMVHTSRSLARNPQSHTPLKSQSRLQTLADSPEMSSLRDPAMFKRLHIIVTTEPPYPALAFRPNSLDALAFAAAGTRY